LSTTRFIPKNLIIVIWAVVLVLFCIKLSGAQEKEKNYSISLVKTAEMEETVCKVDNKKVLTEEYTIHEGEWLWKILRRKGLLEKRNLSELLSVLEKLNKSLSELNLVHPGDKIIIPLKIVSISGRSSDEGPRQKKITPLSDLKDVNFENYTVKQDDSLIRVIKGRYDITTDDLFKDYLALAKRLNPAIEDLNLIYPDQVIRLPIFSPQVVRKPIKTAMSPKPSASDEDEEKNLKKSPLAHDLGLIFLQMGADWTQDGRLFIPLKSGGQLDLKADSFPIIDPHNGVMVIVDLNNRLTPKMVTLIESSWENYRVVHIVEKDDLKSALDKILRVCNYAKILQKNEPLKLGGDIPLEITGDWIIKLDKIPLDKGSGFVVVNLIDTHTPYTPRIIRHYLAGLRVKVVDYPSGDIDYSDKTEKVQVIEGGRDPSSLIKTILNITGQTFSIQKELPIFQSKKADVKLVIRADFSFKIKGKDAVIILTELRPEVVSFLKEHQFSILSLAGEKDPLAIVSKTLRFLGINFDAGPLTFMATKRDESKNIKFNVPGGIFLDALGNSILATPLALPDDIAAFLSKRGHKILVLSFS